MLRNATTGIHRGRLARRRQLQPAPLQVQSNVPSGIRPQISPLGQLKPHLPQFGFLVPSTHCAEQKRKLGGQLHTLLLHVCPPVQVPQSRITPQPLSTVPQFLPAHDAVGVHPGSFQVITTLRLTPPSVPVIVMG